MSAAMRMLLVSLLILQIGAAQAEDLNGREIKTLIEGKTVRLNTSLGLQLPLRYRSNGVVAGNISSFSMARMFAPKEEGRWWVNANRLCQKWPTWYDGRTFCFSIRGAGKNRITWVRDDGAKGSAIISD
ncbi:hypothetical protein ACWKW9_20690 [Rhizobium daejeonense]